MDELKGGGPSDAAASEAAVRPEEAEGSASAEEPPEQGVDLHRYQELQQRIADLQGLQVRPTWVLTGGWLPGLGPSGCCALACPSDPALVAALAGSEQACLAGTLVLLPVLG